MGEGVILLNPEITNKIWKIQLWNFKSVYSKRDGKETKRAKDLLLFQKFIAGVLFLPPSDVYVRSFLYLLYTLIKLYYTKALSDQALSVAPDWILLLQRPRILLSLHDSATPFTNRLQSMGSQSRTWLSDFISTCNNMNEPSRN